MSKYRMGWLADIPDHRDQLYAVGKPIDLPASVDLRPGCPPIYDQGDLGCHDEQTEVLTDSGWLPWTEWKNEPLGTINPLTGQMEFQSAFARQVFDYDGPLVVSDNKRLDFALTPTHRMWVRKWDQRARSLASEYSFIEAVRLGWYVGLQAAPTGWLGTHIDTLSIGRRPWLGNDFLQLLALIISDGWAGGTEDNWNTVSFCCFDERQSDVRQFAARLGLGEVPSRPGVWKWTDPELAMWIRENVGIGASNKRVPAVIKTVSQAQIALFLESYADQRIGDNRQFYTSSVGLASDLQELLLRMGRRSGLYSRSPRQSELKDGRIITGRHDEHIVTEWTGHNLSLERKEHIRTEPYRGSVFCASVPNGLLITRRNGSTLISGNSCTANAIAAALEYDRARQHLDRWTPSRLQIYYNERVMEHTVFSDSGAQIRDGIKSVNKQGAAHEALWPYDISRFTQHPTADVVADGKLHKAVQYLRVTTALGQMRHCLAKDGPFVVGVSVYTSFMDATNGHIPMPTIGEHLEGGHAILIVGYDDAAQTFRFRNSWGASWGEHGTGTLPYAYLADANLSDDAWTITLVADLPPSPHKE